MSAPADGPTLVLHAPAGDLEATAALEFTTAHLGEFRRARTDRGTVALVIGDPERCAALTATGLPTVYLHPAGAAPGDPGTSGVAATVVCWQMPSWLAGECGRFARADVQLANVAPAKRIRSAGGGGPAVLLTGGPLTEPGVDALRAVLREHRTGGPVPVLADLGPGGRDDLVGQLDGIAVLMPNTRSWERALRRADLLVAGPSLLATAYAQAAGLPLRLLPAADKRQTRVLAGIVALAGDPEAGTVAPGVWPTDEGRAGAVGGAAQLARKVRQLCLAPV